MRSTILGVALALAGGAASASTVSGSIDFTDGVFSNVSYSFAGPINGFDEVANGVTFSFATTGQFRQIGPYRDGGFVPADPSLAFGGGGGNTREFTLTVDQDVMLTSFTGSGQTFITSPVFDVTGAGVASVGNDFSVEGFFPGPVGTESFEGGPLNLLAGETYTFTTTNSGSTTSGRFTAFAFTTQMAPVPLPATAPLLLAAFAGLAFARRRRAA